MLVLTAVTASEHTLPVAKPLFHQDRPIAQRFFAGVADPALRSEYPPLGDCPHRTARDRTSVRIGDPLGAPLAHKRSCTSNSTLTMSLPALERDQKVKQSVGAADELPGTRIRAGRLGYAKRIYEKTAR